jgi:phage/plasmid primase-like uncharacterized protein
MKTTKREKVLAIAKELCKANNTVTTLEIKNELRKRYPHNRWEQTEVSTVMNDFQNEGKFTFSDNGTYRVYSLVFKTKTKSKPTKTNTMKATTASTRTRSTSTRISRSKALDMIQNSNGKFFTVTFIKKDGTRRVMNGQHTSDMGVSKLGYINVKDMTAVRRKESATIKSVNLQTIETIRLGKTTYKVA